MTIADRLSLYWSRQVAKGIASKTQIFLENQKDLTSGDDTCLENNWEEYCVQVQDEESIAWDSYIAHTESLFQRFYDELPTEQQFTLWLETEGGQDWYWEDDNRVNDEFKYNEAPIYFEDCIKFLMDELNSIAIDFESENITNYIEYNCNGIDIDDELKDMVVINICSQAGSWEDVTADVYETADVLGISIKTVNQIIFDLPDIFDDSDGDRKVSISPLGWEYYLGIKEQYE